MRSLTHLIYPSPIGRLCAPLAMSVWCWSGLPWLYKNPSHCNTNGLMSHCLLHWAVHVRACICHIGTHVPVVVKLFLEYEMRSQAEAAQLKWFLLYLAPLLTVEQQYPHNFDHGWQRGAAILSAPSSSFVLHFQITPMSVESSVILKQDRKMLWVM